MAAHCREIAFIRAGDRLKLIQVQFFRAVVLSLHLAEFRQPKDPEDILWVAWINLHRHTGSVPGMKVYAMLQLSGAVQAGR